MSCYRIEWICPRNHIIWIVTIAFTFLKREIEWGKKRPKIERRKHRRKKRRTRIDFNFHISRTMAKTVLYAEEICWTVAETRNKRLVQLRNSMAKALNGFYFVVKQNTHYACQSLHMISKNLYPSRFNVEQCRAHPSIPQQ